MASSASNPGKLYGYKLEKVDVVDFLKTPQGWQRDLTRECVESNPGPSWEDVKAALNKKLGEKGSARFKDKINVLADQLNSKYDDAPNDKDIHQYIVTNEFKQIFEENADKIRDFIYEIIPIAQAVPPVPAGPSSAPGAALQSSFVVPWQAFLNRIADLGLGDIGKAVTSTLEHVAARVVIPTLHKMVYIKQELSAVPLPCMVGSSDTIEMAFVDYLPKQSDILSSLQDEIKRAKNIADPDVLVLLGVSGAGKTRTAYDLARKFYSFYFELSRSSAADLKLLLDALNGAKPKFNGVSGEPEMEELQNQFEDTCSKGILRLLLARMITLFLCFGTGQLSGPEDWLYAQLNGVPSTSILVGAVLGEMPSEHLGLLWVHFTTVARVLIKENIPVITDEAHLLQSELFAFRWPSYKNRRSERLYSPHKGVSQTHRRPFLSFWIAQLHATSNIVPIVCGTALRLRNLELIKSAAGNIDMQPRIFVSFPTLDEHDVTLVLYHFLDLSGIKEVEVKKLARELIGRARLSYMFVKIVLTKSSKQIFANALAKLQFLTKCLQEYHAQMTTDVRSDISYRKFFEDLVQEDPDSRRPSSIVLPGTTAPKIVNVIQEVAMMLVSSKLNEGTITFSCTEERDFVNAGVCFLRSVQYDIALSPPQWTASCTIAEPWVLDAATHFFKCNHPQILTSALDDVMFGGVSPAVFGTLFDYRVALTLLSPHWTDKPLLDNPLFASAKKHKWMAGLRISAQQIRDDRKLPPVTHAAFIAANFAKKRKHDEVPDPCYKNCVWLPNDTVKNDVVTPLVVRDTNKGTDKVASVMITCQKVNIAPDIKGHIGFPALVQKVRAAMAVDDDKQQAMQAQFDKLIQGVSQTEHAKNVKQARSQELESALSGQYVVVLIELPCTLGLYQLEEDFKSKDCVAVVVNEDNMNDFFGDEQFVTRFKNHLAEVKSNYWKAVVAAAKAL